MYAGTLIIVIIGIVIVRISITVTIVFFMINPQTILEPQNMSKTPNLRRQDWMSGEVLVFLAKVHSCFLDPEVMAGQPTYPPTYPPRNKGLLRAYWSLVSLINRLIKPLFLRGFVRRG